jgi:hypothetical protein
MFPRSFKQQMPFYNQTISTMNSTVIPLTLTGQSLTREWYKSPLCWCFDELKAHFRLLSQCVIIALTFLKSDDVLGAASSQNFVQLRPECNVYS